MKVIVMSLNFMKRFYYYEITKVDMAAKRRKKAQKGAKITK